MTSSGVCGGSEIGTDPTGGFLRMRSPRQATWPSSLGTQASGNALYTDADEGLWTPQAAMWPVQQEQSGTPNAWPQPGTAWIAPDGVGPIVWQPIVNPSSKATAVFELNIEWEIGAAVWQDDWVELQASANFPGATSITPDPTYLGAAGGTASFCPPFWYTFWHETSTRTYRFQLAPGASTTPAVGWRLLNIGSAGWIPNVASWRCSMKGFGYLVWPVALA